MGLQINGSVEGRAIKQHDSTIRRSGETPSFIERVDDFVEGQTIAMVKNRICAMQYPILYPWDRNPPSAEILAQEAKKEGGKEAKEAEDLDWNCVLERGINEGSTTLLSVTGAADPPPIIHNSQRLPAYKAE